MMWSGFTWAIFMVACVVLMGRMMMGHGRMSSHVNQVHGSAQETPVASETEFPDDVLEWRLVNGEIDVDEYNRLRDILADTDTQSS